MKVQGGVKSWLFKQRTKVHSFFPHKVGLGDGDQAEFWTKRIIFNDSNTVRKIDFEKELADTHESNWNAHIQQGNTLILMDCPGL